MERNIIIGFADNTYARYQADELQTKLSKNSVSSEIKKYYLKEDALDDYTIINDLINDLSHGKIDLVIYELSGLNLKQNSDVTISGLSNRKDASYSLIMNRKHQEIELPLGLKSGMRIGTFHPILDAQLKEVISNITCVNIRSNPENFVNVLHNEGCDAFVLPTVISNYIDTLKDDFKVTKLHPREFIPKAGQGITAYITRKDDKELRKSLGDISDREIISISNIERKVEKFIKKAGDYPVGIYVEKDKNGFVHAYACIVDKNEIPHRVTISQSTTANMAEKIYQELTKKLN